MEGLALAGMLGAVGLFSIAGAAFDWEWFMTNRRARPIVAMFGRTGARGFYALLGLAFLGGGVFVALNPPPP